MNRTAPVLEHEVHLERIVLEPEAAAGARHAGWWPAAVAAGLVAMVLVAAVAVVRASIPSPRLSAPSSTAGTLVREPPPRSLDPYRGIATWIDAADYGLRGAGRSAPITADHVDIAAALGARTVFLQAASPSGPPGDVIDRNLVGRFLRRAHDARLSVVAWYAPTLRNVDRDLDRLTAIQRFTSAGHRFDGIAVDVQFSAVADPAERTGRLLELSSRLREAVGDDPVGAIVPPPILLEDIDPERWPDFPWTELADLYDVFLPTAFWTQGTQAVFRDPFGYTARNVVRLRQLTRVDLPIHVVGGVGESAAEGDFASFAGAVREVRPMGASVYDLRTTPSVAWSALRGLVGTVSWATSGLSD